MVDDRKGQDFHNHQNEMTVFMAKHDTNDITENQVLELSALVSNRVEYLTGQPITESEDCWLALKIKDWLVETGFNVVESEQQ